MKKWKCPSCEQLFDYIECKVDGSAGIDTNGDIELIEWEAGQSYCECGFEESLWSDEKFELVEEEEE